MVKRILLTALSLIMVLTVGLARKVEVVNSNGSYQLLVDGKPFYIKGAGGEQRLNTLKEYGGNSIRTWGISPQTDELMELAKEKDIMVTFGIWLGQERQGFDWTNKEAAEGQVEMCRQVVRKYKDHPQVLIWGVGNELDLDYTNPICWKYLEKICQVIHEEDPNHPVMTVTAGLDPAEIKQFNMNVPSLDILGINTYGNISYIPDAMKMYGWKKPYIVAEWGPYGWWEVAKTEWGASIEETSSEKAATYGASWNAINTSRNQCLGSYVFLWGHKQEHTSTWFGMFTKEGEETEVMDIMIEGWSGTAPSNKAPSIANFKLNGKDKFGMLEIPASSAMNASVTIKDPDNDKIEYHWKVIPESTDKRTGGDAERAPKEIKKVFKKDDLYKDQVQFKVDKPGDYRLFLFAKDGNGNVATGNIPFKITESTN